jgi:hypothetical protein
VLSVLEKIIRLTTRQAGADIAKLSRWLRCLFNLALPYDESISFHCAEQVVSLATKHHGVSPFSYCQWQSGVQPGNNVYVDTTLMLYTYASSSGLAKGDFGRVIG